MNELLASYAGKRIVLTGASGYVAGSLASALAKVACSVVRLSRSLRQLEPVQGIANFLDIEGDLQSRATWESALAGADFVFHLAAQTSVYIANANLEEDWKNNVLPMVQLLECCRVKGWMPCVVYAGTVTQLGIPVSLPVTGEEMDRPVSVYDLHKAMAEQYLLYSARQGSVTGVSLRLANVYGPGPRSAGADRGVLNKMVVRAIKGDPLTLYKPGHYLRDYLYIDDVVEAFLTAGIHAARLNANYFVVGSGQGFTIDQALHLVAERVALKTGRHVPVQHVDPPDGLSPIESRNFVADSTRFSELTGWRPRCLLPEGIDRTASSLL